MQVILFTQPDCHLCEMAKLDLADLQDEFQFEFRECNILDDKELLRAYRLRIPVVEIRFGDLRVELAAPLSQLVLRQQIKHLVSLDGPRETHVNPI